MTRKVYATLSVFQGVIDEVKAYRTKASADRFVARFEKDQGIRDAKKRKYQREYNDTYASWYECELER